MMNRHTMQMPTNQKSLGQAVMVSDFIDEVDGYLKCGNEEARLYLGHQSEGYFTNDLFVDQVCKAMNIFKRKYPGCSYLIMHRHIAKNPITASIQRK